MERWKTDVRYLDQLLDVSRGEGIVVPEPAPDGYGTLFLISGPPGSGKSTLAIQMSASWARQGKKVLYLSFERDSQNLHDWLESSGIGILDSFKSPPLPEEEDPSFVVFRGREALRNIHHMEPDQLRKELTEVVKDEDYQLPGGFDAIVLDGFNSEFEERLATKRLSILRDLFLEQVKLLVVIYDGPRDQGFSSGYNVWQYAADVVVEFFIRQVAGYELKKLRILKARNQRIAFGEHLVKLWPQERTIARADFSPGIMVFPSEHFFLTRNKASDSQVKSGDHPKLTLAADEDPAKHLENLIPPGKVTVLAGRPGSLKRNLAHRFLLDGIGLEAEARSYEVSSILLSLREPETTTRERLEQTYGECGYEKKDFHHEVDIRYFDPGAIAPEEFLVILEQIFKKPENDNHHYRVVIQDLSQLEARFPLCARSPIFLTAITEFFRARNITALMLLPILPNESSPIANAILKMADQVLILRRFLVKRHRHIEETDQEVYLEQQVMVLDAEWNERNPSDLRFIEIRKPLGKPLRIERQPISWDMVLQGREVI